METVPEVEKTVGVVEVVVEVVVVVVVVAVVGYWTLELFRDSLWGSEGKLE